MQKTSKKRTEMGNFDTLKLRIRHGLKAYSLHIIIFLGNLFAFGLMIAIIFKLLSTLSRIA